MKPFAHITLHLTLVLSAHIVFSQSIATDQGGPWQGNAQWENNDPYPSASNCYPTITIGHSIGIQNSHTIDLSGCGVVDIIIDGGELKIGDSGGIGGTLILASGSTVTVTNGGVITGVGAGSGANATINIGGNEVWDGSDADVTGEGTMDESSTNGSLPVELIGFYGRLVDGKTILTWTTSSEINNMGFFVEMGTGKGEFKSIGWVDGNGTTNSIQKYSFEVAMAAASYFRLKQVDYDGEFEYHPTIFVESLGTQLPTIDIYPNPVTEYIHITGQSNELTQATLIDITGSEIIPLKSMDMASLEKEMNLLITYLNPGTYVLNLVSPEGQTNKRLILQ